MQTQQKQLGLHFENANVTNSANNEENYNYVIKELQNYILNKDFLNSFITKFVKKEITCDTVKKETQPTLTKQTTSYPDKPKEKDVNINWIQEKDSLFCIFYVMVFGEVEYEKLKPITLVKEKKIKIDFIEKSRLKKSILKTFKFATLVHIENQLLNELKIDLNTFFSLCAIENKSVFYVNKNTYYELLFPFSDSESESEKILLLKKIENPVKFRFQLLSKEVSDSSILDNYRTTLYKIESLHKPVKAISNYNLSELKDLSVKLGLEVIHKETGIVKKKMELYEQLVQYF